MYTIDFDNDELSNLSQYINELEFSSIKVKVLNGKNLLNKKITYISYDSRDIIPGTLFICKGQAFKKEYLLQAIEKGAVAYVSAQDYQIDIPLILVNNIRKSMAILAYKYFDRPQDKLKIIGITGTKGKSTTVSLLYEIIKRKKEKENALGPALISSYKTYDGRVEKEASLTTPEPMELFHILYNAVKTGIDTVVMEVSSQALKYERVYGINFQYGAFLNISPDHISDVEHSDFEDYLSSKLKLINNSEIAVINLRTDLLERVIKAIPKKSRLITTAVVDAENNDTKNHELYNLDYKDLADKELTKDNNLNKELLSQTIAMDREGIYKYVIDDNSLSIDYLIDDFDLNKEGLEFKLSSQYGNKIIKTKLHGFYNLENLAIAIAIAADLNIDLNTIEQGIANLDWEKKSQIIKMNSLSEEIIFIIDRAHNGLSFKAEFDFAKQAFPEYRRVVVFGTVGNKSESRRKDLALACNGNVDKVYLTRDDNNFEDVNEINAEIANYLDESKLNWISIQERKDAIRQSFSDAEIEWHANNKKTCILLLGKGSDEYNYINGKKAYYKGDEYYARKAIDRLNDTLEEY